MYRPIVNYLAGKSSVQVAQLLTVLDASFVEAEVIPIIYDDIIETTSQLSDDQIFSLASKLNLNLSLNDKELVRKYGFREVVDFVPDEINLNKLTLEDIIVLYFFNLFQTTDLYSFFEEFTNSGYNQSNNRYVDLFLDYLETHLEEYAADSSLYLLELCSVQHDICQQDALFEEMFEQHFPTEYQRLKKKVIAALLTSPEVDPLYWFDVYVDVITVLNDPFLTEIYKQIYSGKSDVVSRKKIRDFSNLAPALSRVFARDSDKFRKELILSGAEFIVDQLLLDFSYFEPWIKLPSRLQHRYLVRYILKNFELSESQLQNLEDKFQRMGRRDLVAEVSPFLDE